MRTEQKLDTVLDSVPPLTLHDLLQLHLQGLDGSRWVVSKCALYPVDGQPAFHHSSHIIVLQKYHPVGVLDHGAAVARKTAKPTCCYHSIGWAITFGTWGTCYTRNFWKPFKVQRWEQGDMLTLHQKQSSIPQISLPQGTGRCPRPAWAERCSSICL